MQVKTKRGYHLTPVRMAISQKSMKKKNVGEDTEKREPLYTTGENVNCCSLYVKQYGDSSKDKKNYHIIQQFHSWVYTQKIEN